MARILVVLAAAASLVAGLAAALPGAPTIANHYSLTVDAPVACGAPGSCVAVSLSGDLSTIETDTLTGRAWKAGAIGLPSGSGNVVEQENPPGGESVSISQVACSSAESCVAVGTVLDPEGNTRPLVVSEIGGTWNDLIAPLPPDAVADSRLHLDGELSGVTCSASSCVAVGGYESATGTQPLVLSGSGTSWSPVSPPLPADAGPAGGELWNVSCASASCLAVGDYQGGPGLLETGNGLSWTASSAPAPPEPSRTARALVFDGEACLPASCVAVGGYFDRNGVEHGFVLSSRPGSVSLVEAPVPSGEVTSAGKLDAVLHSVGCARRWCVAAGDYSADSAGDTLPLLLGGSGRRWSEVAATVPGGPSPAGPSPAGVDAVLNAVSCAPDGRCVAGGDEHDGSSDQRMLVLTRTRGSWRAVEPPDPWGNQVLYEAPSMPGLYFAACDPVSLCVASGDYQVVGDQFSPVDGLIETIRVPVG